jgi:hypothetical protein
MTDLSPAAQAVLDAHDIGFSTPRLCLAAALRSAADQTCRPSRIRAQNDVRYKLLAIADELEAL